MSTYGEKNSVDDVHSGSETGENEDGRDRTSGDIRIIVGGEEGRIVVVDAESNNEDGETAEREESASERRGRQERSPPYM